MYSNNPVTEEKAYDLINGCMYFLISLKNLWCYLVSKYLGMLQIFLLLIFNLIPLPLQNLICMTYILLNLLTLT